MPSGGAMARNKPEGTYTTGEVARMIGKSPSTVRRWCHDGYLPSTPVQYKDTTVYYVHQRDVPTARALAGARQLPMENRTRTIRLITSDKDEGDNDPKPRQ